MIVPLGPPALPEPLQEGGRRDPLLPEPLVQQEHLGGLQLPGGWLWSQTDKLQQILAFVDLTTYHEVTPILWLIPPSTTASTCRAVFFLANNVMDDVLVCAMLTTWRYSWHRATFLSRVFSLRSLEG